MARRSGGILDKRMLELAEDISRDKLPALGNELGFSNVDIDRFARTNAAYQENTEGTLRMIHEWRDNKVSGVQVKEMVQALRNAGLLKVAEKHFPDEFRGDAQSPSNQTQMPAQGGDSTPSPTSPPSSSSSVGAGRPKVTRRVIAGIVLVYIMFLCCDMWFMDTTFWDSIEHVIKLAGVCGVLYGLYKFLT